MAEKKTLRLDKDAVLKPQDAPVTKAEPKSKTSRSQRPFTMGDSEWVVQACQLTPMMGNFAWMLWMFRYMDKGQGIVISAKKLTLLNITKRTSDNLLALLKDAGLITVERHKGRAPRVRLIASTEPLTFGKLKERWGFSEDAVM